MKLPALLTALAVVPPAALATSFPACSSTSVTPCSCPAGTAYEQSVTFAVIGAKATDVETLISGCSSSPEAVSKLNMMLNGRLHM